MIHSLVLDAEPPCGSELVNASICLGLREPCTDRSCWEEAAPGVSTTHSRPFIHTTPSSRELRLANSSDCFSERPPLRKLMSLCSGCLVVSGGQPVSGPARPLGGRYRSGGLFLKVDPSPPCTVPSTHRPLAWNVLQVQAQNLCSQLEWTNTSVPQWACAGCSWTGIFFPMLSPSCHHRTDWHLEVPAVLLYYVKSQWGPWAPDPGLLSQAAHRDAVVLPHLASSSPILGHAPSLPLWSPLLPLTYSNSQRHPEC